MLLLEVRVQRLGRLMCGEAMPRRKDPTAFAAVPLVRPLAQKFGV